MPRPERLLDPTAGPLEEFAHALRGLRRQAGNPSYRTMAKQAHYSVATLSEAARGLHKPSLKVTLAYVAACGGDPESWTRRWYRLSSELEASGRPARGQPESGLVPAQPAAGRRPAPGAPATPARTAGPRTAGPRVAGPRVAGTRAAGTRTAGARAAGTGAAGTRRTAVPASAAAPAGAAAGPLTGDERAELRRLRSEVEQLRHANAVLKAASAIFAADLRTNSQVVYNPAEGQDPLA